MTTTPPPVTGPPEPPPETPPPPDETPPPIVPDESAGGLTSSTFWARTAERAIKSAAQVLVVVMVAKGTGSGGVDVSTMDWPTALGLAGGAALLSVLMSLASRRIGPDDSPSVI
jgi:hypothetical protein